MEKLYDNLTLTLSKPTTGPLELGTVAVGSNHDYSHLTVHLPYPIVLYLNKGDKIDFKGARVVPDQGVNIDGQIVDFLAVRSFSSAEVYIIDNTSEEGFRRIMNLDGKRLSLLKQVDRYSR